MPFPYLESSIFKAEVAVSLVCCVRPSSSLRLRTLILLNPVTYRLLRPHWSLLGFIGRSISKTTACESFGLDISSVIGIFELSLSFTIDICTLWVR